MSDKIRVLRAKVMAESSKFVTYTDEGGTLRKAAASRVEIVDSMEDTPQDAGEGTVTSGSDPEAPSAPVEATVETPPSSDKPLDKNDGPTEEAASTPPSKPKQQVTSGSRRKKDMATAQTSAAKKKAPPPKAKVAAKKSAPRPRTEASGVRTIGGKAVNLDGYEKVKTPAGGTSYHNGDAVAEKLVGKTLDEVYVYAAKTLKEDEKALRAKYKHLNVGMQRMSLGNRLRKVLIPKTN